MKYTGGVIKGCVDTRLDHGILAVGYGVDPIEGKYYVIRNSWGTRWGESGYARILIQEGDNYACGILQDATIVEVVTK